MFSKRLTPCTLILSSLFVLFVRAAPINAQLNSGSDIIDIGSRLELFTDYYLVGDMDGVSLEMHKPVQKETAVKFDKPWEGRFCGYPTVIKDGLVYHLYYRGMPSAGGDGSAVEVTCYAFSFDGIHWTKPSLGIHEVFGSRDNNIILYNEAPFTHNFAPFLDTKPGIPKEERFKAFAGTERSGLVPFVSKDGVHWKKLQDEAVITDGKFDSQNVAFWSEAENCYVCYFRTWSGGGWKGHRTISRSTSDDFIHWSEKVEMDFGDTPAEQLYTNQTTPYFRAPHIYLSFPMRFMPGRKVLSDEQAKALAVHNGKEQNHTDYSNDCAEVAFMTSRGGTRYNRTFMEGFIRPGLDPGNWASRTGMVTCGIAQTGPEEISIYKQYHYAQPSAHLVRYALRLDGFASVNAPYAGGVLTTKALRFTGSELVLNFSTGASGGIRIELLDSEGTPIPGYTQEDSDEIVGDSIERTVTWNGGSDVSKLSGRSIKLRVTMKDADLFSLKFK